MGQLTWGALLSEACLKAGKDPASLVTRAGVYGNARLRSLYKGWPFPWLQRRLEGLALGTGITTLSVGAGSGGVTEEIKLIRSPVFIYTSDYSARYLGGVRLLEGDFEDVGYPSTRTGLPNGFRIRPSTTVWGRWDIRPTLTPDRNYLLAFDYQIQPADMTDLAAKPIYPNDRTIIAGIEADVLHYMHGPADPDAQAAEQEYSALAQRDRAEYGSVPGINDQLGLDPGTFR